MSGVGSDEYDLTQIPQSRDDRVVRTLRFTFAFALAVPIGGLAWYAATLPVTWWATPGGIIVAALVVFFASVLGYAVAGFGPSASRLVFDTTGFVLRFRSGRERHYRWADQKLKIRIDEAIGKAGAEYSLSSGIPFKTKLTQDLMARLLTEARTRGLVIKTSQFVVPGVSRGASTKFTSHVISHKPLLRAIIVSGS